MKIRRDTALFISITCHYTLKYIYIFLHFFPFHLNVGTNHTPTVTAANDITIRLSYLLLSCSILKANEKKKSHSDWVKFPAASIIHGEIKDKFTAQRKWIGLPGPETSREICSPRLLSPGNSGTNGINVKTLPWKIQRAPLIEKAIGRRRARVIDAEGKTGVNTFGIFRREWARLLRGSRKRVPHLTNRNQLSQTRDR